jgi:hypothetical protein
MAREDEDYLFWHTLDGYVHVAISQSKIIAAVSEHEVVQMFREEVARQLREDEELRILVREAVKSAIASLDVGEIVKQAVSEELKANRNPNPPSQTIS